MYDRLTLRRRPSSFRHSSHRPLSFLPSSFVLSLSLSLSIARAFQGLKCEPKAALSLSLYLATLRSIFSDFSFFGLGHTLVCDLGRATELHEARAKIQKSDPNWILFSEVKEAFSEVMFHLALKNVGLYDRGFSLGVISGWVHSSEKERRASARSGVPSVQGPQKRGRREPYVRARFLFGGGAR